MSQLDAKQAAGVLQEVSPDRSFSFYASLGSPLGVTVNSLRQLIESAQAIPIQSIEFHTSRGDFSRWVSMLGDGTLSKQIETVAKSGLQGEKLRKRLVQTLKLRYGWLKQRASAKPA
jgi:hypothetical protein